VLHSVEAAAVACFTEHGHLAYLSLDSGATTSDDPPPVKITPSSTSFRSHSKALVPVPSAVGMLPLTPREGALVPVGAINTRFTTESEQAAPLQSYQFSYHAPTRGVVRSRQHGGHSRSTATSMATPHLASEAATCTQPGLSV
jgi:hypothetical protein